MTYLPDIPQANDQPAASQPQILSNFQVINSAFGVDHIGMTTVTNRGKHRKVTFPVGSAPGSLATEGVLYAKTVGSNSQVFYQRDASATEFQLTGDTSGAATNGYTFLFGGFYIEWGIDTTNGSGVKTITFSKAFSTSAYAVVTTPIESDTTGSSRLIKVTSKSATQFAVFTADRTGAVQATNFSWIAIGRI